MPLAFTEICMLLHIVMIVAGLGIIATGFYGTYYTKKPFNIIAPLFLPVGLVMALIGVLLLCVPNFFQG